jgi:hypothetical protein
MPICVNSFPCKVPHHVQHKQVSAGSAFTWKPTLHVETERKLVTTVVKDGRII